MASYRAPAKINLTLEILARRPDGYHGVRSVMVPIARYDRFTIEPADETTLTVDARALGGPIPGVGGADDLVLRALRAVRAPGAWRIAMEKTIPVGGGLGGGSSDAATIVRAAMEGAFGEPDERDRLAAAGALGSDVPFFLCGTGALVEGVGERVTPLGALPPWWVLVARPPVAVATAQAYAALAERRLAAPVAPRPRASSVSMEAVDGLQRADFAAVGRALSNDFHALVLAMYPAIAQADAALRGAGAEHVLLSGSGSCVFALFADEPSARACEAHLDPTATESAFVAPFHRDDAWS